LDAVSKELFNLHLLLAQDLSANDRDLIVRITTEKVVCTADGVRARHCRKFQCLQKDQHPHCPPDSRKTGQSEWSAIWRSGLLGSEQGPELCCGSGVCPR
jgi:hypothetical protein